MAQREPDNEEHPLNSNNASRNEILLSLLQQKKKKCEMNSYSLCKLKEKN